MASTDARPVPKKNTACRIYFPIYDNDGDLVTGASALDSEVSIDGAAFGDCTSEATEIGSTGIYYLDLTAAEMNGDAIVVQTKTTSTNAKTSVNVLYPEEAGDIRVDVTQISGDGTAADNLETATDGGAFNVGGGAVVAASVTGHTPQTGDSFARIGLAGAGLTALGDTRIANLNATVSSRLPTSSYTAPDNASAVAAAASAATAATQATSAAADALIIKKLNLARKVLNTGTTPWRLVFVEYGTGTLGAQYLDGTILATFDLRDYAFGNVTVATTPVASQV